MPTLCLRPSFCRRMFTLRRRSGGSLRHSSCHSTSPPAICTSRCLSSHSDQAAIAFSLRREIKVDAGHRQRVLGGATHNNSRRPHRERAQARLEENSDATRSWCPPRAVAARYGRGHRASAAASSSVRRPAIPAGLKAANDDALPDRRVSSSTTRGGSCRHSAPARSGLPPRRRQTAASAPAPTRRSAGYRDRSSDATTARTSATGAPAPHGGRHCQRQNRLSPHTQGIVSTLICRHGSDSAERDCVQLQPVCATRGATGREPVRACCGQH